MKSVKLLYEMFNIVEQTIVVPTGKSNSVRLGPVDVHTMQAQFQKAGITVEPATSAEDGLVDQENDDMVLNVTGGDYYTAKKIVQGLIDDKWKHRNDDKPLTPDQEEMGKRLLGKNW